MHARGMAAPMLGGERRPLSQQQSSRSRTGPVLPGRCPGRTLGTSRRCFPSPITGPMLPRDNLGHSSVTGASTACPLPIPIRSWPSAGSELERTEAASAGILDDPAPQRPSSH
jgi:hypothetical protein